MADPYERSIDLPASMSDDAVRAYVQERELTPYGQVLIGEISITEDNGSKRATWSSQPATP